MWGREEEEQGCDAHQRPADRREAPQLRQDQGEEVEGDERR